jgi:threonine/homoserine/homoserine lactone efflux protein
MSERDERLTFVILWAFVLFNYIYGDIGMAFSVLIDPAQMVRLQEMVASMGPTDLFFLGGAVLMEISILTLLLSWLARHSVARWANILAGILFTVVMVVIIFARGVPPPNYYTLYGLIEIAATAYIAWRAWNWSSPECAGSRSQMSHDPVTEPR